MDEELFKNIKDGLKTVGEIERKNFEEKLNFAEKLALKTFMESPWVEKNTEMHSKIQELEKIIASQRHELALQAKFREEDAHARQLLDPNACQRRVFELEAKLTETQNKLKDAYQQIEFGFEDDVDKQKAEEVLRKSEDEGEFWRQEIVYLLNLLNVVDHFNREEYWKDVTERLKELKQ